MKARDEEPPMEVERIATGTPWESRVEVSGLVDPEMLVEIEAEAYVPEEEA